MRRPHAWLLASSLVLGAAGTQDEKSGTRAVEQAVRRFDRSGPADRDANLDELVALVERHPESVAELGRALELRYARTVEVLARSKSRRGLERLVERRSELDAARAHALELILDEKLFFYPFRSPEVDPEIARRYPEVLAEVRARVEAVRTIWNEEEDVAVPPSVSAAWDELAWLTPRARELKIELSPPAELPAWLLVQNARLVTIGLRELALDEGEARALDRDRSILARNDALWADTSHARAAGKLEMEQVRLTNEYRRMMGRRVLAWNPRLQESAAGHSEYMAQTGELGHDESVPGRESPWARMSAAGYSLGTAENCYWGSVLPFTAHEGWLASSMHHRNILSEETTEMASALAGIYWTQNFGCDRAFERELGR